jgi:hypothetical protein
MDDGRPLAQHKDELRAHIDASRMKRIQRSAPCLVYRTTVQFATLPLA